MVGRVSQKRDEGDGKMPQPYRPSRSGQFIALLFAREKEIRVDYGYYAVHARGPEKCSAETNGGANRRQLMSRGGFLTSSPSP